MLAVQALCCHAVPIFDGCPPLKFGAPDGWFGGCGLPGWLQGMQDPAAGAARAASVGFSTPPPPNRYGVSAFCGVFLTNNQVLWIGAVKGSPCLTLRSQWSRMVASAPSALCRLERKERCRSQAALEVWLPVGFFWCFCNKQPGAVSDACPRSIAPRAVPSAGWLLRFPAAQESKGFPTYNRFAKGG